MITVLYRISSNEVIKISFKGQTWPDRASASYSGVLTDPPVPDGTDTQEVIEADLGPRRQLGFAKINDSGTVRNATQVEIDTWQGFEDEDENEIDAEDAKDLLANHPRFRKVFIAFAKMTMNEINILRSIAGLPDRTLAQLKTALQDQVSKDD